ncbi:MAG TPA: glycosyl hydrolase family 28-related protein [Polyangia bacterium]
MQAFGEAKGGGTTRLARTTHRHPSPLVTLLLLAGVGLAGCSAIDLKPAPEPKETSKPDPPNTGGSRPDPGSATPPRSERGMKRPWVEYQAEDGQTNAKVLGPSREKWDANHIEAEAIGRKAVRLSETGHFVAIRTKATANSIVVRFSIPDAPNGGGIDATLGLYVNGKRTRSLELTSRYAWSYKGALVEDPIVDKPAEDPHTFFDEAHALVDHIPEGAEVKLQKDEGDKAAFYIIDLIDLEEVAPPQELPDGFTSVTDFGVVPDDGKDDGDAIMKAIAAAKTGTKKLWFPKGIYVVQSITGGNLGLDNPGIEIRGAGMWHTRFTGPKAVFFCAGETSRCVFSDFAIFGDTKARVNGANVAQGFAGPMGKDSRIENVWIEHQISGIWVGSDPPYQKTPTDGLTIRNCRIRNVYANGVNLANGTSNTTVENSHVRNSGDEGFVVWPIKWTDWVTEASFTFGPTFINEAGKGHPDQGAGHGNVFRNLTVQMPWRAQCFGSYGGYDNLFENSLCEDVLTYPGILIDNEFSPYPFGPEVTTFRDITVVRAGGYIYPDKHGAPSEHGAVEFYLREGSISDVVLQDIDIVDPTYAGVAFRGFGTAHMAPGEKIAPNVLKDADEAILKNISLKGIKVVNAGTYGIQVKDGAGRGSVSFQDVVVTGSAKGAIDKGGAPETFFKKVSGNQGW